MFGAPVEFQPFVLDAVRAIMWTVLIGEHQFTASVIPEADNITGRVIILVRVSRRRMIFVNSDCLGFISRRVCPQHTFCRL